tara:strand:- start:2611 stop:3519 length:909 start_codon:yes stop_codon:yes gene_type:complete
METTVRETIKKITFDHLKNNHGLCFGQCLTAVGWVGGTLPELYEDDGMIEVTTADVANAGFVVGAGLKGKRPIYVVRYQGFQWYNAPMIVNYACKSKEIWSVSCPIFIRSIAMEGGIGPVAGSSHHSLFYRMPGIKIISPMTPKEYKLAYKDFMENDDVYYISEHRRSYDNAKEFENIVHEKAKLTLFPFSITRFDAEEARVKLLRKGIKINIIHQVWIKPLKINKKAILALKSSEFGGIVLDDDYVEGIASDVAHKLMLKCNKNVHTIGLKPKTAGFHPKKDNLPPSSAQIMKKIKDIIMS